MAPSPAGSRSETGECSAQAAGALVGCAAHERRQHRLDPADGSGEPQDGSVHHDRVRPRPAGRHGVGGDEVRGHTAPHDAVPALELVHGVHERDPTPQQARDVRVPRPHRRVGVAPTQLVATLGARVPQLDGGEVGQVVGHHVQLLPGTDLAAEADHPAACPCGAAPGGDAVTPSARRPVAPARCSRCDCAGRAATRRRGRRRRFAARAPSRRPCAPQPLRIPGGSRPPAPRRCR